MNTIRMCMSNPCRAKTGASFFFLVSPNFFPTDGHTSPSPWKISFTAAEICNFTDISHAWNWYWAFFTPVTFFFKDVFQILCIMTLIHYQTQSYNRPCQHQTACWAWYSGNNLACAYSHQTQDTQIAKAKSACSHSNWSDPTLLCGMTDSTL